MKHKIIIINETMQSDEIIKMFCLKNDIAKFNKKEKLSFH